MHVAELVRALRERADLDTRVRCFGAPRDEAGTTAYADLPELAAANAALQTLGVDLAIAAGCAGTDLVHSHTWYANFGGHLASLLYGVPHVVTAHSPRAAAAVEGRAARRRLRRLVLRGARRPTRRRPRSSRSSAAMRDDVLAGLPVARPRARFTVVHNGIDTEDCGSAARPGRRARARRRPGPAVGGLRRPDHPAEGAALLLRAAAQLPPEVQLVLCAGAPDTPEIVAEVEGLVDRARAGREGVVWIPEMLPRPDVVALLSAATAFACPSIYEPLGIVNLEAMACEPAVVATATGGIPEVVVHGETGWLVPIEQVDDGTGTPLDPDAYVADFAAALTEAVADRERAKHFGLAGRARAVEHFSWGSIGDQTMAVYEQVLGR